MRMRSPTVFDARGEATHLRGFPVSTRADARCHWRAVPSMLVGSADAPRRESPGSRRLAGCQWPFSAPAEPRAAAATAVAGLEEGAMTTTSQSVAALSVAVFAGLGAAAPGFAGTMHWSRSSPAEKVEAGSTAVLGVVSMGDVPQLQSRYGFRVVRAFPQLHAAEVKVSRPLLAAAARDDRVRYLSSLGGHRPLLAMPNDPMVTALDPLTGLPWEWQFAAAHVDRAFDFTQGSPSIRVGMIDTGVADVPDLAGKVDQRWAITAGGKITLDPRPIDIIGHGTAVASLIASNVNDGFGMAGFGGASHLVVMHVWSFTDTATAVALMKLDSLGVRIVNMSFGSPLQESPIMLDAIHKAEADGMLLVAASGNSAQPVAYPAADLQPFSGAESDGLAVGASDVHGDLAFFSNFGSNLSLLAPGGYDQDCTGVLTAVVPTGGTILQGNCYPIWSGAGGAYYGYLSGTSFAAPEVAGIAALIWAVRPGLKNYQVADIIKASAERSGGWSTTMGCGVLDAGAALQLATSLTDAQWATTTPGGAACSATGQD